ncbi:MAG: hypothetical protein KF722_09365 [Nitrospira sp.]|nr:hypothetical protein [Nitrospira sp.]
MTTRAHRTNQLFSFPQARIISCPNLQIPSHKKILSRMCGLCCILFIAFEAIATLLVLPVSAQPSSPLGSSCQGNPYRKLSIEKWSQGDTPWCWATTAAIAMHYHGEPLVPCKVVTKEVGGTENCCDSVLTPDSQCLIGGRVSDALKHFNFTSDYKSLANSDLAEELSFSRISEQLCSNGPFISQIEGPSTFHAIVVYGYAVFDDLDDPHRLQVSVHDPQEEWPPFVTYDFFLDIDAFSHTGRYYSICKQGRRNCRP